MERRAEPRARSSHRPFEVAGDDPTPQQMADALSAAGGRRVSFEPIDLAGRDGDIAAMYRYLEDTGYQVDIAALLEQFPEVPWTSFARWAGDDHEAPRRSRRRA